MSDNMMTFQIVSPQYQPRMMNLVSSFVTEVAEEITVTCDTFANSDQADYVVIYNQAGQSAAVWLDLDADGTEPTGDAYLAADFQLMASIVTGDLADDVAAAVVAALGANLPDVTVVDNLDGTITITQDLPGATTDAAVHNADDSGAGSLAVSIDTDGVTGECNIDFGTFNVSAVYNSPGDYTITFNDPFVQIPEIVAVSATGALVPRIKSAAAGSVNIEILDLSAVPTDSDLHILISGCMAASLIS